MNQIDKIEFLSHILLSLAISFLSFRKFKNVSIDLKIFAAFISFWTSLVLTSLALACFSEFGNNHAFWALNLILQILINFILRFFWMPLDRPGERIGIKVFTDSWVKKLLLFAMFVVSFMVCYLATHSPLQIPDTLSIKLPNAFLYLKSGSFLAPTHLSDDGRMFSTPLNGTIFWSYLIRWHQPVGLIIWFNLFCWIVSFFAIFRIARQIGGSHYGSFIAATLFAFSLPLLFQASSDNDDLLSSISAILGAIFLLRWIRTLDLGDMLFAALGIGLSLGAKMFPALYIPACFALFIYFCLREYQTKSRQFLKKISQLFIGGVLAISLLAPFIFVISKQFHGFHIGSPLLDASVNKPFRAEVGFYNVLVYNLQALVSPLTDATLSQPGPMRDHAVEKLNSWAVSFVPDVQDVYAYVPGVRIVHRYMYENTVWYGFLSLLLFISFVYFLFKSKWRWRAPFWLSLFFIAWDIFFCMRSKYIEELGRYWVLAFALAAPILAILWDETRSTPRKAWAKIIFSLFILISISTFSTGFFGIAKNTVRYNYLQAWRGQIMKPQFDESFSSMLASCDQINVSRRVYGYPIFYLFRLFRGESITYNDKTDDRQNMVLPGLHNYLLDPNYDHKYVSISTDGKMDGGFRAYGEFSSIPIFAERGTDCKCQALCEKEASLIVVELTAALNDQSLEVPVTAKILNRHLDPDFRFDISAKIGERREPLLVGWDGRTDAGFKVRSDAEFIEIHAVKSDELYLSRFAVTQP